MSVVLVTVYIPQLIDDSIITFSCLLYNCILYIPLSCPGHCVPDIWGWDFSFSEMYCRAIRDVRVLVTPEGKQVRNNQCLKRSAAQISHQPNPPPPIQTSEK